MSAQRSKAISKSFWQRIGRAFAWIGSVFLWFITPTGAAELWEKWIREANDDEALKEKSKRADLDKDN